jgi:hypothetical protein
VEGLGMSLDIAFDESDQIIVFKLPESFTWQVLEEGVPLIANLHLEHTCSRILLDFRQTRMGISTLKIYQTPPKLAQEFEKFNIAIRDLKRAFLMREGDEDMRFFETVSLNNLQNFKAFTDVEKAREWLLM